MADGPGRAKAVRNISNFEKIPKRDGSVIVIRLIFTMDAGPDQEPVQNTKNLCDARLFIGLGYETYSVPGGLNRMPARKLYP